MKLGKNMGQSMDKINKHMGIRSQTCMKFKLLFDSNEKFVSKRPYIKQHFRRKQVHFTILKDFSSKTEGVQRNINAPFSLAKNHR